MTAAHTSDVALDTSALVAVLQGEEYAERIVAALDSADACFLSAATAVEPGLVMLAWFGEAGEREADVLLHRLGAEIVPVTRDHVELARSAYRRFGKGRHPAGLKASTSADPVGDDLPLRGRPHDVRHRSAWY